MYSDISILNKESASPNTSSANNLAKRVLPTPVGPKNMNEPTGLFLSLIPIRLRLMALTTLDTAISWPITLPIRALSMLSNFLVSCVEILLSGIPVIIETTSEINSTPTSVMLDSKSSCHLAFASFNLSSNSFSLSLNLAASSYFCFLTTSFF